MEIFRAKRRKYDPTLTRITPIYHEESKSFTLVPAWHAELYTYPYQEDPDHIRVAQVFLDAYDGHQLYPPEEVPTDAAS